MYEIIDTHKLYNLVYSTLLELLGHNTSLYNTTYRAVRAG